MRKQIKRIEWISSCLLIFALFSTLLLAQEVKIEKIDGVIVVHNPKKPVALPGLHSRLKS